MNSEHSIDNNNDTQVQDLSAKSKTKPDNDADRDAPEDKTKTSEKSNYRLVGEQNQPAKETKVSDKSTDSLAGEAKKPVAPTDDIGGEVKSQGGENLGENKTEEHVKKEKKKKKKKPKEKEIILNPEENDKKDLIPAENNEMVGQVAEGMIVGEIDLDKDLPPPVEDAIAEGLDNNEDFEELRADSGSFISDYDSDSVTSSVEKDLLMLELRAKRKKKTFNIILFSVVAVILVAVITATAYAIFGKKAATSLVVAEQMTTPRQGEIFAQTQERVDQTTTTTVSTSYVATTEDVANATLGLCPCFERYVWINGQQIPNVNTQEELDQLMTKENSVYDKLRRGYIEYINAAKLKKICIESNFSGCLYYMNNLNEVMLRLSLLPTTVGATQMTTARRGIEECRNTITCLEVFISKTIGYPVNSWSDYQLYSDQLPAVRTAVTEYALTLHLKYEDGTCQESYFVDCTIRVDTQGQVVSGDLITTTTTTISTTTVQTVIATTGSSFHGNFTSSSYFNRTNTTVMPSSLIPGSTNSTTKTP